MLEIGTTITSFEMEKHNVLEIGNGYIALLFGRKKIFVSKKKITILPHPTEKYKWQCYMAKWLFSKLELPLLHRGEVKYGILYQTVSEDELLSINFS